MQTEIRKLIEGELFKVDPLGIDRSIFEKPREDGMQEDTRKIILEAFDEVDEQPKKYAELFYTLIPEKNWNGSKKIKELKKYANDLGGQTAEWVHQALEWAQRISNGETWEMVCNIRDTSKWYRLIIGKKGYPQLVGGSHNHSNVPASYVRHEFYSSELGIYNAVPLIMFKKEVTMSTPVRF